jgi:predicted  nucleic acid-binding Zn-ribbon protein
MYSSPKPILCDISERIESFELRSKKGSSFEVFSSNFHMLEKCLEETIPTLQIPSNLQPLQSFQQIESETREGLIKFCRHYSNITREMSKIYRKTVKEFNEKWEKLSKDLTVAETLNKKLNKELEKTQAREKFEMEKIEKEIEEIFGKNDLEILGLKRILKEHQDSYNQDTVDFLLQLCRAMDQDHDIPDLKNSDFLGMDPSEIPELMWKKFSFVQRFTAKKISDILKSKKNTSNHETQTYTEYIAPAAFEEQSKHIEKLQIQLNSAFISIEKYRESFGSKVNVLESLEGEKNHLLEEVSKLRKEVEALSHSIEKSHFELKKVSTELDHAKKERDSLAKDKQLLSTTVVEKEKTIEEFKGTVEKFEKTVKDKEDKIQGLEKTLAKRKKRKGTPADDQPVNSSQKRPSKFDEKEFLASMKSGKRGSKDSSFSLGGSVSEDPSNSRLSTQGGPGSSVSSSSSKSKKSERAQSPGKRSLNVKLNQIDEVPSPGRSPRRNDEKYPEINISAPGKSSRSRDKSRGTGTYAQDSDDELQSKQGRRRLRPGQDSGSEEDDQNYSDFSDDRSSQEMSGGTRVYVKRPQKNSRHSQISDVSRASRGSKGSRGSEFYDRRTQVTTRATSMDDLIWENSIKFSKAVQMNGMGVPDDDERKNNDGVYIFPYNPNQFYALRGDKFYHTGNSVFAAQPRIPDLKNSVNFNSPYLLASKEENKL